MPQTDTRNVSQRIAALQKKVAAYQTPNRSRAIWQLSSTLILYAAAWAAAYIAYGYSFWLSLPFIFVGGLLMIRVFILFHDCGHQSFFKSRKANTFWGVTTGLLTFTPFSYWHACHARHHATSANLDKRGVGDVWMMTVSEYLEAPLSTRIRYRLYRNPLIMFLLGPLLLLLVKYRIAEHEVSGKHKRNVLLTNIGLQGMVALLCVLLGPTEYLVIQFGIFYVGVVVGIWLFYVQHQFEDVYWARRKEWNFVKAALDGGSFYDLPPVLRWFTASIGYHHIHHLNSRIPNYRLAACQSQVTELQDVPRVGLRKSLKALWYRLLDEQSGEMVGFRHIRGERRS